MQLNWDTSAELSRLLMYVYCKELGHSGTVKIVKVRLLQGTGTQRNCQNCQGTSIAIELGHSKFVKIVKVRLLQLNWDREELSRLSR